MNRENYVTSLLLKSGNFVILLPYLLLIYFIPPLIFGLFFAYLVYPIFNFFKRTLKLPFSIVVIIFSLLLFSTIVTFIFLFIQSLLHLLPTLQTALLSFSKTYSNHPLLPYFVEKLSTLINDLTLFFIDFIKNMINSIFELFIFIITFYFSLFESRKNRLWFFSYTPKKYRAQWSRYFEKSMNLIGFFVVVDDLNKFSKMNVMPFAE